jgi:hypothetical protein
MKINFEGRRFELVLYTASHRQAIFQSLYDGNKENKIEVLFKNVIYLECPAYFEDMHIEKTDDVSHLFGRINPEVRFGRENYLLSGRGWSGFVCAGYFEWGEFDCNSGLNLVSLPKGL